MCSHPRPKDYKIPENYKMSKEEVERIKREEDDERKAQQVSHTGAILLQVLVVSEWLLLYINHTGAILLQVLVVSEWLLLYTK